MYKSRPIYIPKSEDTNGSLHYPFPHEIHSLVDCGVFLCSFSVVEQFVCTEKMDLQKSAAVVFFFFAFKHWVFCFVLVKFTDA